MKPSSLKTQRILMWIPYLNFLIWVLWGYQRRFLGVAERKYGLVATGLAFLIFLPTSILVQLFPDALLVGWVGFYLCGWVPDRYLIRVQEKLGQ